MIQDPAIYSEGIRIKIKEKGTLAAIVLEHPGEGKVCSAVTHLPRPEARIFAEG